MGGMRSSVSSLSSKRGVFVLYWPWFLLILILVLVGCVLFFVQNPFQNINNIQSSLPKMLGAEALSVGVHLPPVAKQQESQQHVNHPQLSKSEAGIVVVKQTLSNWASAWSALDAEGYLSFYAADFEPAEGLSRNEWEQQRRARIGNKNHIDVKLENLSVETDAQGSTAIARFIQHYRSDNFSETIQKTMILVLQNGHWKIIAERAD